MLNRDLPFLALLTLGLAGAVASGVYAAAGGTELAWALAAAAISCSLAAVAIALMLYSHSRRLEEGQSRIIRDVAGFHSEVRRKTDALQDRVAQTQNAVDAQATRYAAGLSELRESYAALQNSIQNHVANVSEPVAQANPEPEIHSEAPPPVAQPEPREDSFSDKLSFALEPVVDVQSGRTLHYRLHVSAKAGSEELSTDRLLHYAGRVGKRSELDMISLREAGVLLEKLRVRDPEMSIFVNIGAETLADPHTVAQIALDRSNLPDAAEGIIYEMPHAMLAGLSEGGLEGLAALARVGGRFALSNVSVTGLDLQAMNTLNVRHVGVAATAIDPTGPSTALIGFAQMARLSRVSVIVMGLSNPALVNKIGSMARLACGPCFAEPRKVKRNLTGTPQFERAAA